MSKPVTMLAEDSTKNGTIAQKNGKECIFQDGYWLRYYAPPENTLKEKKELMCSLQRRVFHHTEAGINTPGWRLEIIQKAYEVETNSKKKRIKASMLAGALFNRAVDIFSHIVELEEKGVKISSGDTLFVECEGYFVRALELGKQVKHFSGEEGVDELWGEPLKAFSLPIEQFFASRYIKLAQTFLAIDQLIDRMIGIFQQVSGFEKVLPLLEEYRVAAQTEVETMRRDVVIYEVWPRYVSAKENLIAFKPCGLANKKHLLRHWEDGLRLLSVGVAVVSYLSGVRVPMPRTTAFFLTHCDLYEKTGTLDSEFSIAPHCYTL